MMIKKSLFLLFIVLVFPNYALDVKKFSIGGYSFSTYNVRIKNLGKGGFELTILPTPSNWPMVHITPKIIPFNTDRAEITIEQVFPEGATSKRIHLVVFPKGITTDIPPNGIAIQDDLKDNKAHKYVVSLKSLMRFSHFSINAHAPENKIILKVSNIRCLGNSNVNQQNVKIRLKPLPPVTFKGKPFFPIGAFDMATVGRTQLIDPGFIAAGGNIGLIGTLGMPGHAWYEKYRQPVMFPKLKKVMNNPAYQDIALIVGIDSPLWMDGSESKKHGLGGYHKPVSGKELNKRRRILAEDIRKLASYSNIIGYWIDEPENLIYSYYSKHMKEDWEKKKDAGLSEKMVKWANWIYEVIHKEHPSAKMMPTLAWWTTYEAAGAMYDINIPNDYSNNSAKNEDLFTINYDAHMAVCAARKLGGGRTVIYMPGMFDIMKGDWAKAATIEKQRYACFAPIACGVMGIFGWRLQRCSQEYRNNVIYPVMSEVAKMKSYFLGSWHDELITSDHDKATVDYLKKFKERVTLMQDGNDGEIIKVKDAVPDVSYCLRRDKDTGKYLLLAVNNRRENLEVTFKIKLNNLPPVAIDILDLHQIQIKNGAFKDKLAPFDVHAYVFKLDDKK